LEEERISSTKPPSFCRFSTSFEFPSRETRQGDTAAREYKFPLLKRSDTEREMAPTAATATVATTQKPSRKGKKAWRKNVVLTDVQDGLEEQRSQEKFL
jgi:hypothetical protein